MNPLYREILYTRDKESEVKMQYSTLCNAINGSRKNRIKPNRVYVKSGKKCLKLSRNVMNDKIFIHRSDSHNIFLNY